MLDLKSKLLQFHLSCLIGSLPLLSLLSRQSMNFLCRGFAKRFGYVVVFIKILRKVRVRGFAEEPSSAASDRGSVRSLPAIEHSRLEPKICLLGCRRICLAQRSARLCLAALGSLDERRSTDGRVVCDKDPRTKLIPAPQNSDELPSIAQHKHQLLYTAHTFALTRQPPQFSIRQV